MAQEPRRGCGYRKVGGLYLEGEYTWKNCDRLPMPVEPCPVCGAGIHFSRNLAKVNPFALWGNHDCSCNPCNVCYPPDALAFVVGVGEKYYTPQSFMQEAATMGVSKRIPFVPKDLKLGETVVYLTHKKAIEVSPGGNGKKPKHKMAVFSAFIPQKISKLIWKSQATKAEFKKLWKQGITPVVIKDGDKDHQ